MACDQPSEIIGCKYRKTNRKQNKSIKSGQDREEKTQEKSIGEPSNEGKQEVKAKRKLGKTDGKSEEKAKIPGRKKPPEDVKNSYEEQGSKQVIRHRLVVTSLNVESLISNKETLEMYLNDKEVHIIVVTESNITESKLDIAQIDHYTIANKCYRPDTSIKGGGGGGVLIYIHESVPFITGEDQNVVHKGQME